MDRNEPPMLWQICQMVPFWISVKDGQGRYVLVNAALANARGMDDPAWFVGRLPSEVPLIGPVDGAEIERLDREVLTKGRSLTVPRHAVRLPGSEQRTMHIAKLPLRKEDGGLEGVLTWCHDITAEVAASGAQQASTMLLDSVMNALPHWISVKDADGRFQAVNAALANLYGVPPADLVGKTVREAVDAYGQVEHLRTDVVRRLDALDAQVLAGGTPAEWPQYTLATRNGQEVVCRTAKFPLRDAAGQVAGVVSWTENITESVAAKGAQHASERRLQTVLDAIPHPITLKDAEGRFVLVNEAMRKRSRMAAEDVIGRRVQETTLRAPEDTAVIVAADARVLAGEAVVEIDKLPLTLPDGRMGLERLLKVPYRDADGAIAGVVTIGDDISERIAAAYALRASEARLQTVVDSVPHEISLKDGAGRYVMVNRAFAERTGLTAPQLIGSVPSDLTSIAPEVGLSVMDADRRVLEGRSPVETLEFQSRRPDGGTDMMRAVKAPTFGDSGRITGVVTVSDDMTEILRGQAQLARTQHLMARAEEVAGLGALDWDLVTGEQYWSDSVYRIVGHAPQSFVPNDKAFSDLVHPEDRKRVLVVMSRAAREGLPIDFDCRIVRPDGATRLLAARAEVTRNEQGAPARMVGTVQDVTDQRRSEQELRRTQKMDALGRLISGVTHEFNNVLQVVGGFSHIALRRPAGDPAIADDLAEVIKACDRGANLARRLLAFGRQGSIRKIPLELNQFVKDMEKMLLVAVGESVELALKLTPDLPVLEADRDMIEQVVLNLALNARDAMPKGGSVEVATGVHGRDEMQVPPGTPQPGLPMVSLSIADTGVGMEAKVREHIFDPFFTTKEAGRGTGLGLSTVHGIVAQHGGWITVDSELGRGSCFTVYLPASGVSVVPANGTEATPIVGGTEIVLIVENDRKLLQLFRVLLARQGFTVLTAVNGAEAMAAIVERGAEIQAAILDVFMPGISGGELASQIREARPGLPMIFVTGAIEQALNALGPDWRDAPLLVKPIEPEQLHLAVRNAIDRRPATARKYRTPVG